MPSIPNGDLNPELYRQNRDDRNGRFTFDGDMTRLCVCGHTLGDHFGGAPHDCAVGTLGPLDGRPRCECPKFRLSRKKVEARAALSTAQGSKP